jgi:hypothetical protein
MTLTNTCLTIHLGNQPIEPLLVQLTMSRNFPSLKLTASCLDQSSLPDVTMTLCDGSLKKGEVEQISATSIRRTDVEAAQSEIDVARNNLENRCFPLKRFLRSGKVSKFVQFNPNLFGPTHFYLTQLTNALLQEAIDDKTVEMLVRECENTVSWLEDQCELTLECVLSRHKVLADLLFAFKEFSVRAILHL